MDVIFDTLATSRDTCDTILDLLRWRAEQQPDEQAYAFLGDGEHEEASITYEGLDRRARAIASYLQSVGVRGDRVLLLLPPGPDYIAGLFGAIYAGMAFVPCPPSATNGGGDELTQIVKITDARIALTSSGGHAGLVSLAAEIPGLRPEACICLDDVPPGLAEQWEEPAITRNSLLCLFLTSSPASPPRAVMHNHRSLFHGLLAVEERYTPQPNARLLSSMPPYVSMSILLATFFPLFSGFPAVLMSPAVFRERPARCLQAISRTRATHSLAPNFAYDLCTRMVTAEERARLDLSGWEVAVNAGEPKHPDTLNSFADAFRWCGFRPEAFSSVYGLSETLVLSAGRVGVPATTCAVDASLLRRGTVQPAEPHDGDTRSLTSCGPPLMPEHLAIVDPERHVRCSPDEVGEIWFSGPSAGQGYWGIPDATEQTFLARLDDTGEGPFVRTGDLGFLRGGEVFVCGRLKAKAAPESPSAGAPGMLPAS